MKTDLYNNQGELTGSVPLSEDLFGQSENNAVVTQLLRVFGSHLHQSTSSTKTRAEGTGRARHGSRRSPIWVHGGVTHGPKPSSMLSIPKSMKRRALTSLLSTRCTQKQIAIIDDLSYSTPKTQNILKLLNKLPINRNCLILLPNPIENTFLSARNIPGLEVTFVGQLSAIDVLSHPGLIIDSRALPLLEKGDKS